MPNLELLVADFLRNPKILHSFHLYELGLNTNHTQLSAGILKELLGDFVAKCPKSIFEIATAVIYADLGEYVCIKNFTVEEGRQTVSHDPRPSIALVPHILDDGIHEEYRFTFDMSSEDLGVYESSVYLYRGRDDILHSQPYQASLIVRFLPK